MRKINDINDLIQLINDNEYEEDTDYNIDLESLHKIKDDLIHVTNIGGPLKHLEYNWKFIQKENFTEVHFDVDFEIKNKFLDMIMTKSFEFGLNKIADAFQERAEKI